MSIVEKQGVGKWNFNVEGEPVRALGQDLVVCRRNVAGYVRFSRKGAWPTIPSRSSHSRN